MVTIAKRREQVGLETGQVRAQGEDRRMRGQVPDVLSDGNCARALRRARLDIDEPSLRQRPGLIDDLWRGRHQGKLADTPPRVDLALALVEFFVTVDAAERPPDRKRAT